MVANSLSLGVKPKVGWNGTDAVLGDVDKQLARRVQKQTLGILSLEISRKHIKDKMLGEKWDLGLACWSRDRARWETSVTLAHELPCPHQFLYGNLSWQLKSVAHRPSYLQLGKQKHDAPFFNKL